jgi:hypothetical protein
LAGFPCIDFKVTLDDGSFHAVDSSEMAFKIAGALAYRKAAEQEAMPVLLEPIMSVTVTTPDEYMGDIMGDLNGRRGRVLGMDSAGKNQVIKAQVPMAEFLTYAPDLRSMTGGRGMYTMEFSHYDEVPAQLAKKSSKRPIGKKNSDKRFGDARTHRPTGSMRSAAPGLPSFMPHVEHRQGSGRRMGRPEFFYSRRIRPRHFLQGAYPFQKASRMDRKTIRFRE